MADNAQARFLLRGTALLIVTLGVWWFLLLNPLLSLLRSGAEIAGSLAFGTKAGRLIRETRSGGWRLQVPVESARLSSIEFTIPRADTIAFTFSLPIYWALILAAPGFRRAGIRPLIQGTLLIEVFEILLFLLFLKIVADGSAAQITGPRGDFEQWLSHFSYYLVTNVLPYAAPFVMAIGLHRELRWLTLGRAKPYLSHTS
jgi:hypothetical protein